MHICSNQEYHSLIKGNYTFLISLLAINHFQCAIKQKILIKIYKKLFNELSLFINFYSAAGFNFLPFVCALGWLEHKKIFGQRL